MGWSTSQQGFFFLFFFFSLSSFSSKPTKMAATPAAILLAGALPEMALALSCGCDGIKLLEIQIWKLGRMHFFSNFSTIFARKWWEKSFSISFLSSFLPFFSIITKCKGMFYKNILKIYSFGPLHVPLPICSYFGGCDKEIATNFFPLSETKDPS